MHSLPFGPELPHRDVRVREIEVEHIATKTSHPRSAINWYATLGDEVSKMTD